jgi:PAS domain S-box-containing protein
LQRDRAIVEHVADALFVYDPEGRILDVNRRAGDTLGYSREELLSLSITDLEIVFLPEGVAGLWRRLTTGEPVAVEGMQRRKDGTSFPVEVRVGLLETNGRRLALCVARYTTESKTLAEQFSYRAFHNPLTGLPNRTSSWIVWSGL